MLLGWRYRGSHGKSIAGQDKWSFLAWGPKRNLQGTNKDKGDHEEGKAQEKKIKLFMNSWAYPLLTPKLCIHSSDPKQYITDFKDGTMELTTTQILSWTHSQDCSK